VRSRTRDNIVPKEENGMPIGRNIISAYKVIRAVHEVVSLNLITVLFNYAFFNINVHEEPDGILFS
jgi:hypothetical protein